MYRDNFIKKCIEKCNMYDKENNAMIDYVYELNQKYKKDMSNNSKFNNKINEIRTIHENNIGNIEKINTNLMLIQDTLNKMKNVCEKKYHEYMFCKYKNGITFSNIQIYANDYLIINYGVLMCEIDNLVNKCDKITYDIIGSFHIVGEHFNMVMEAFNLMIEEEIINIKKKNIFNTYDWIVMASHKHNNKYDYTNVKYVNLKTKVDIICPVHGMFSQRADLHLKITGCSKCNLEIRIQNIPFENSFASVEKSNQWSPKNKLKPNEVFKYSNEKFLFDCNVCSHEFSITLANVKYHWCPYCVNQKLCKDNCDYCYDKSFASTSKILKLKQWSDNNELTPREVFKSSNTKYLFNCDNCDHEISMSPYHISINVWCYYCTNKKVCDSDSCDMCYKNSFAINEFAKHWSPKNIKTPRMVLKSSAKKYIFDCPFCKNEYIRSLSAITQGYWCGCTFNKTETKLYNFLKTCFVVEKEKKFNWCKNVKHLPFDFCIEEHKIIIELDGDHHFKDIKYFKSTREKRQETDKYKMIQAKSNGYSIIRIFQLDVWRDRNNWVENLHRAIIKAKGSIGNPIVIYIGKIYETDYFLMN